MSAMEVKALKLLDQIRQLPADEFDHFLEQALSLRAERPADTLSPKETKLVLRINRGLSADQREQFNRLTKRRKKGTLTAEEHGELLKLTHEAESLDADRAAALLELAKGRQVPLRVLMDQMGIKAPPING